MKPASRDQDELNELLLHPEVWHLRMAGVIFTNAYPLLFFPRANVSLIVMKRQVGKKDGGKKMRQISLSWSTSYNLILHLQPS